MAATYLLAPTAVSAFSFQPTIDGAVYNCVVRWNLFGQRWYVEGSTLAGQLVFSTPLVPSDPGYELNVLAAFFPGTAASMVYYGGSRQIVMGP